MCISTARTLTLPTDSSCKVVNVDSNTGVDMFLSFMQDPAGTCSTVLSTRYFMKLLICRTCTVQSVISSASLDNSNDSDSLCCDSVRRSNGINSAASSLLVLAFFNLGLMPIEAATALGSCRTGQTVCSCHQADEPNVLTSVKTHIYQ